MEKKIARPYSKVGGMGRLDPPQTGTGILGCDEMDKLIPEYHIPFSKDVELPSGSTATVFDKDGLIKAVYKYDKDKRKWELL